MYNNKYLEQEDTPPDGTTTQEDTTQVDAPVEGTQSEGGDQPSTGTDTPAVTIPPAAEAPTEGAETAPRPQDELDRRVQELERDKLHLQSQQGQAELLRQRDIYAQQLETQNGYLPEQAQYIADSWASSQGEKQQLQQELVNREQFIQGQANAAEHFAKTYSLQLADLSELRKHSTPESMEEAAKRMKSDRDKDAEIAELRAKLVPSQSFDDSQSTPAASNDEDRWLERYNQGDRSEQASAAARRAAGLG